MSERPAAQVGGGKAAGKGKGKGKEPRTKEQQVYSAMRETDEKMGEDFDVGLLGKAVEEAGSRPAGGRTRRGIKDSLTKEQQVYSAMRETDEKMGEDFDVGLLGKAAEAGPRPAGGRTAGRGIKDSLTKEQQDRTKQQTCLYKQLRKTKLCMYNIQGNCQYGEQCSFAHSIQEVNHAPDLRKTRICKAFEAGECKDPQCGFAHGEQELRSTDMFFKKALCIWNAKGKCRNGASCRFAHGVSELRSEADREREVGGLPAAWDPVGYGPMKVPTPAYTPVVAPPPPPMAPMWPTQSMPLLPATVPFPQETMAQLQLAQMVESALASGKPHLQAVGQEKHSGAANTIPADLNVNELIKFCGNIAQLSKQLQDFETMMNHQIGGPVVAGHALGAKSQPSA